MRFVREQVRQLDLAGKSVLECGSADVNGSVRSLFTGSYVGLDRNESSGVDVVGNADDLPWDDETFEVVIATEMLEHDPTPWKSVREMARVLAPHGHLILTARGFNEHGAFQFHNPPDVYRFSLEAISALIEDAGLTVLDLLPDPQAIGVFATAIKHGVT